MKTLIKVSGDAMLSEQAEELIQSYAVGEGSQVVVVVGGGTEISRQLSEAGYEIKFDERYDPPRRIAPSFEEKCIIRGVLDDQVIDWRSRVGDLPNVEVISPFETFGRVLCNINGDDLVRAICTEFDVTFVLTKQERKAKKKKTFAGLPVKILAI